MNGNEFKAEERPITKDLTSYEDAYVKQRYKEIHDYLHTLLNLTQINILNELKVKIFELSNIGVPSAFFASIIGSILVSREDKIDLLKSSRRLIKLGIKAPNVMNVYFEEHFN